MKYLASTLMIFLLLKGQLISAQRKLSDTAYTNICGHTDVIFAIKQGTTYFLKINSKRQKVGSNLTKDSALVAYKKVLNTMLAKECGINSNRQPDFVRFVNTFSIDIDNKLFLPPKSPISGFPVLIDSIGLDQKHFIGLIKTTNNSQILSEYVVTAKHDEFTNVSQFLAPVELFKWDSTGKLISFDSSAFKNDAFLLQHFPECLKLQLKASPAKYPQFYLLYNGTGPNYELISCYGEGIGTHTTIIIQPEVGETIKAVGKATNLKIGGTNFDVQLIKNSAEKASSANSGSKSEIPIKGRLITDLETFCIMGSYYISANVYSPSPADSIIFSLKFPGKPILDTVMPIDFSYLQLKNWIVSSMPTLDCSNLQAENNLSSFIVQCVRSAPIFASAYLSSQKKISLSQVSTTGQSEQSTSAVIKTAGTDTNSSKSDPKAAKTSTATANDLSAKYNFLNNLNLLNAFNFDFTGKLSSSYLGLFNVFAPGIGYFPRIKKYWGLIAGIEKINYSTANINGNDSTQNVYLYQYVLKNPLDYNSSNQQINSGAPYYYQYNKYILTSKNTVWSFYFDPIFRTDFVPYNKKDRKIGIYWNFHLEFLVNEFTRTINMQTLDKDSANYGSPNSPTASNMNKYLSPQYAINSNIVTENIGTGLILYAAPFKDTTSHFYFQFTAGLSFNSPNFQYLNTLTTRYDTTTHSTMVNLPNISNALNSRSSYVYSHPKCFYLFRAAFSQSLSNKTELIIGMTIRGLYPIQTPQYAAYLGLNLDLSILTDLFSSK